MRIKPNDKHASLQTGSSFLFVIFIVLCLVVLATLSLSTAIREQEYSKKAAQKVTEYYQADSLANRKLMQIDLILQDIFQDNPNATLAQTKTALQNVADLDFSNQSSKNKELIITYYIPVNAKQQLQVTLSVAPKQNQKEYYRITTWNVISATDWQGETHLPVIGSE